MMTNKRIISEHITPLWVFENGGLIGDQDRVVEAARGGVGVLMQPAGCFRREFRQTAYVDGDSSFERTELCPVDPNWTAPKKRPGHHDLILLAKGRGPLAKNRKRKGPGKR